MSQKSIVWVHRYGERVASYRYRASIPCSEVGKINGYTTAINDGEADIVVFSKPNAEELPMARKAKEDGAKVVVDFADDHFSRDDTYNQFAELADGIVCASNVMRGRIYDYTKRDSVAIGDPYEQEECEPHADGDNFLWFGHIGNWQEVVTASAHMGERKMRVVTGPQQIPDTIPWSPENMKKAFAMSNIVILPTQRHRDHSSPNRLINSVRAGCFPVCMSHPAYDEFKKMVWVGNFPTGLKWVDAFKQDLNALVKEAQDYVRDRYSPQSIGQQWATYLESV